MMVSAVSWVGHVLTQEDMAILEQIVPASIMCMGDEAWTICMVTLVFCVDATSLMDRNISVNEYADSIVDETTHLQSSQS
jgi:hypothetical protein